jgi:hypothetical protein
MNRIEVYCPDITGFAWLREFVGRLAYGPGTPVACGGGQANPDNYPVVIAEEFNEASEVVRTWFVMVGKYEPVDDGSPLATCTLPHKIVSRDIKPGEPTPAYDLNAPITIGKRPSRHDLQNMRAARDDRAADRHRHTIYCQQWHDHLATIKRQAERIKQLESELSQADAAFKSKMAAVDAEFQRRDREFSSARGEAVHLRRMLEAERKQFRQTLKRKSFLYRLRLWGRAWK